MISRLAKILGFDVHDKQKASEASRSQPLSLRKGGYRHGRDPKYDPSIFLAARDLWDSIENDWRLFRTPDGSWVERPLSVAILSNEASGADKRIPLTLHDGLGLRFNALRASGRAVFLNCETCEQIGDAAVDAYLDHGGLLIGALDMSPSMLDLKEQTIGDIEIDYESMPLWQRDRLEAAEHLAIVKFAILQFGQALFMEGDTKETRVFLRLICEHWMPSFAWHIDIWHQLAAGIDRFRYSDMEYRARSREVVQIGSNILEYHGIASSPILCDPI